MQVLVTGAGGFIGSHVTELLLSAGHSVRAFVHYNGAGSWQNLTNAPEEHRDQLDVRLGDVTDPSFSSGTSSLAVMSCFTWPL